jgi:hypothetical protein
LTTPPTVSRHRPGQNRRHILDCLHAGRPALFETEHRLWGAKISRLTGLPKGAVYYMLRQMVKAGTLIAEQAALGDIWRDPATKQVDSS